MELRAQLAEFSTPRLVAPGSSAEADAHRNNADRVEFGRREIAAYSPELTVAAWAAAGPLTT